MKQQTIWMSLRLAVLLAVGSALACKSDAPPERAAETKAPVPWTVDFQEQSILFADVIEIEGPAGIMDHVAYKQIPDQKYSAKTTPEGFLQEVTAGTSNVQIWLYLDNLTMNAVQRGRWLERVGDVPVRITARGNAYWKNLGTGEEKRAPSIELVGARPR